MNFKKLKNFSIIVVPEETSNAPKSIKISSTKLITYIVIYSAVIFLLGFYVISFTPLSEVLFPYSLRLTESDKKKVEVLNKKVTFLANEIESLKSVNERLRFAIMLGDSTLLKDKLPQKDTTETKNHFDGNILSVFLDFISKFINNQNSGITFIEPVEGFISKTFNPERGHNGNDYSLKENSPVYASSGGYVVFANYTTDFGYIIILNHPENYITKYMHCASLLKKEGDFVRQGELIALSGNSGTESTGSHLHFEIWKDGKPIDPAKMLIKY